MDVLIYVDEGVVERSRIETPRTLAAFLDPARHTVRTIDRAHFCAPDWEDRTAALIMPGGRDLPYLAALSGEANERIRRFVEGGGAYIGFCAGAYYGAQRVEFDLGRPLEVVGERELGFFPGAAVGPAYGLGTFDYASDAGARAAQIAWCAPGAPAQTMRVFYNGGCRFEGAEDDPAITVLARYAELPGAPAAILSCRVGAGVAVLSGVHPEYSIHSFRGASPELSAIHGALSEHETSRQWLLAELFTRARLTLKGDRCG